MLFRGFIAFALSLKLVFICLSITHIYILSHYKNAIHKLQSSDSVKLNIADLYGNRVVTVL